MTILQSRRNGNLDRSLIHLIIELYQERELELGVLA